jgi:hypothetical protein
MNFHIGNCKLPFAECNVQLELCTHPFRKSRLFNKLGMVCTETVSRRIV